MEEEKSCKIAAARAEAMEAHHKAAKLTVTKRREAKHIQQLRAKQDVTAAVRDEAHRAFKASKAAEKVADNTAAAKDKTADHKVAKVTKAKHR